MSQESFQHVAALISHSKGLKRLRMRRCGTLSAGAIAVLQAVLSARRAGVCTLVVLEIDEVKFGESHELDQVPFEVLQEGSARTASYLTSQNKYPQIKPQYNTKLIIFGDQGCGKSTLVDALFPLAGDLEASEGWYGYFSNTQYHYRLEGNRLQKYASLEAYNGLQRPLEDVFLERDQWTVSPIEDWANYGIYLVENVSPYRALYIYADQLRVRDLWLFRLRRVISGAPTQGISFSSEVVDHAVISQATQHGAILNVSVLDFSGDRDRYFLGQQVFIQSRALYLATYDISKGEAGVKGLGIWLRALVSRLPPPPKATTASSSVSSATQEAGSSQNLYSVIVVGTHADNPAVSSGSLKARTERLTKLYAEVGLAMPVDYVEVSGTTGANIDVLQSAVYFVPLTHSYMAEKLPNVFRLVEQAVQELRKANSAFPIVPLDRVVDHCNKVTVVVDKVIVKVALRLLSAWGRCLYLDHTADLAGTVILDPEFFSRSLLFRVLEADTYITTSATLDHQHLAGLWPSIASRRDFEDHARMTLEYLYALGLAYHQRGGPQKTGFLESFSIFPLYLSPLPPMELRRSKAEDEYAQNWWPEHLPAGSIEVARVYDLTHLTQEFVSHLLVLLRGVFAPKTLWRYGIYHETWRLKVLAQFEVVEKEVVEAVLPPVPNSASDGGTPGTLSSRPNKTEEDAHHPVISLQPRSKTVKETRLTGQLHVRVRGDKRARCRATLVTFHDVVDGALRLFAGTTFIMKAGSSSAPLQGLLAVKDLQEAAEQGRRVTCPATGKELDPAVLLVRAGLRDDPQERENFWWSWFPDERWNAGEKEGLTYSRYLFVEDGKVRDADCYEKLRQLIGGPEEAKRVVCAYAVHNERQRNAFEEFQDSLKRKGTATPADPKRGAWRLKHEPLRREALLRRLEGVVQSDKALWNESGRLPALAVMAGVREKDAWAVCSGGFGALKDNNGCLGKGIYTTPSLSLAAQKAEPVEPRGYVVVVALATLGNVFPVVEHPFSNSTQSYLEKDCEPGFQSHYATVNKLSGYPIAKEFNSNADADQVVLFNQSQLLPLFVIYCK